MALGFVLLIQCLWWAEGLLGIMLVFHDRGPSTVLSMVEGKVKLICAALGLVVLIAASLHLFIRNFGRLKNLRKWSLITFVGAFVLGIGMVYLPAANVFKAAKEAPYGYLYAYMLAESGNVDFPVMEFVQMVPYAGLFNLLFLIPLFMVKRDR